MVEGYNADQVAKLKSRVTYVGALINIFLSVIKVGFGILGQSAALIADGIHSLSDLASDLLVIAAIKLGAREADHDHPYGHRRFETMATVALGSGLIIIAAGISWDVAQRLLEPEKLLIPDKSTLAIAAISILANEWLFHYTKRIGLETRSKLLMANAWHHRSDALSSVVVLFGIIAVYMGYAFADAIAAVIVALMVAKIGLELVTESIRELVDTSLPEDFVKEIRRTIKTTQGVKGIHLLRTRQMGEDAFVDAHIVVDPRITVSEGHVIGDEVRDRLIAEFDNIVDVLVHIDPEDDEFKDERFKLPSRYDVTECLKKHLAENFDSIEDFNIHYLDNQVELEIILPHALFSEAEQVEALKSKCSDMEKELVFFNKVFVFFRA